MKVPEIRKINSVTKSLNYFCNIFKYIPDMLWSLTKFDTDNDKPNAYNYTLLLAHNKVPQKLIKYNEVDIGAIQNSTIFNKIHTPEISILTPAFEPWKYNENV